MSPSEYYIHLSIWEKCNGDRNVIGADVHKQNFTRVFVTRNSVAISPRHERKLENPVWPNRDQLFGTAGRPRPEPKSWAGSHRPLSGQLLPGSDDQDISQKPVSLCPPAVTQPVREAFSLTLTSFDGVSCQLLAGVSYRICLNTGQYRYPSISFVE